MIGAKNDVTQYWLGLWAPGENLLFEYLDNSEVDYTAWATNNPGDTRYRKNCVTMSSDSEIPGKWENDYCYSSFPSICSKYPNGVRYQAGCEVIRY